MRWTSCRPAGPERLPADHVFLLTGYHPDTRILEELGVKVDAADA